MDAIVPATWVLTRQSLAYQKFKINNDLFVIQQAATNRVPLTKKPQDMN